MPESQPSRENQTREVLRLRRLVFLLPSRFLRLGVAYVFHPRPLYFASGGPAAVLGHYDTQGFVGLSGLESGTFSRKL